MRMIRTRSAYLLAGALLLSPAAVLHAQTVTVVLVRHAEKIDESADPPLSRAGEERAAALAAALEHAGVQKIYVTQYRRTRDSAAPLARRLGIEPVTLATVAGGVAEHARQVAARIREHDAGGLVLAVGHSNTVPAIIAALGGPDVGEIGDDDYHDFFVLQISPSGVRLIRSRY
jgi:broad specificity phosphatase PhoE